MVNSGEQNLAANVVDPISTRILSILSVVILPWSKAKFFDPETTSVIGTNSDLATVLSTGKLSIPERTDVYATVIERILGSRRGEA